MLTKQAAFVSVQTKAVARKKCLEGGDSCTSDDHACKELAVIKIVMHTQIFWHQETPCLLIDKS